MYIDREMAYRILLIKGYILSISNNIFILVFVGWCLVWKLYLSKFKLVRELFSQQTPEVENSNKNQKTL